MIGMNGSACLDDIGRDETQSLKETFVYSLFDKSYNAFVSICAVM